MHIHFGYEAIVGLLRGIIINIHLGHCYSIRSFLFTEIIHFKLDHSYSMRSFLFNGIINIQ